MRTFLIHSGVDELLSGPRRQGGRSRLLPGLTPAGSVPEPTVCSDHSPRLVPDLSCSCLTPISSGVSLGHVWGCRVLGMTEYATLGSEGVQRVGHPPERPLTSPSPGTGLGQLLTHSQEPQMAARPRGRRSRPQGPPGTAPGMEWVPSKHVCGDDGVEARGPTACSQLCVRTRDLHSALGG